MTGLGCAVILIIAMDIIDTNTGAGFQKGTW